jgi:hypothetical protein
MSGIVSVNVIGSTGGSTSQNNLVGSLGGGQAYVTKGVALSAKGQTYLIAYHLPSAFTTPSCEALVLLVFREATQHVLGDLVGQLLTTLKVEFPYYLSCRLAALSGYPSVLCKWTRTFGVQFIRNLVENKMAVIMYKLCRSLLQTRRGWLWLVHLIHCYLSCVGTLILHNS